MTLTLPSDLEKRIKEVAKALGMDAAEYARQLIAEHLPPPSGSHALTELFAQWETEDPTDDPAEVARRNGEVDEFKRAMNRNRHEMEGADDCGAIFEAVRLTDRKPVGPVDRPARRRGCRRGWRPRGAGSWG